MLSEKEIRERIAESEKALAWLREERKKVRENPWKYSDPEGYLDYLADNAIMEKTVCDVLRWVLEETNKEAKNE